MEKSRKDKIQQRPLFQMFIYFKNNFTLRQSPLPFHVEPIPERMGQ